MEPPHEWYTTTGTENGYVELDQIQKMQRDIRDGNYLPFPYNLPVLNEITWIVGSVPRALAASRVYSTWLGHNDYFTKHFPECREAAAE